MRKLALLLLILIAGLLSAGGYAVFVHIPHIAQEKAQQGLRDVGLLSAPPAPSDVRFDRIVFENIALGEDGFSTLQALEIHYNPLQLLAFGRLESATVRGLNLTGELSSNMQLSIAGWDDEALGALQRSFQVSKLAVLDSRLSLLTPQFGGVNARVDIEFFRRKNAIEFQGRLSSEQKTLDFTAALSGSINRQGLLQSVITLEQARFETETLKATRMAGQINLAKPPSQPPSFVSSFEAGGLNINGFGWKNATGSFEGTPRAYKIFLDAKSVGVEEAELSLNSEQTPEGTRTLSGRLHADTLKTLFDYLQSQNALPTDSNISTTFANIPDISVEFLADPVQEAGKNILNYSLTNDKKDIDINGKIEIADSQILNASFSSEPLFLNSLNSEFLKDGSVTFAGSIEQTDKSFTNRLKATIKDAVYAPDTLALKNMSGDVVLDDFFALSTTKPQALRCKLPLRTDHQCTLNLKVTNGALDFSSLNVSLFDGRMSAQNINPLRDNDQWVFSLKDINLWSLLPALGFKNATGTGALDGHFTIVKKDGRLILEQGLITNSRKGVFRYLYDKAPAFFEGDELELETIRIALQNYHFNDIEIRMNGALDEPLEVHITGRGTNPSLYGASEISLNLKTKVEAQSLLQNLLEKPAP